MHFREAALGGLFELELEPHEDERGFFARTWCAREFQAQGLPAAMVQSSVSQNARKGTVRGMHFQWPPSQEGKLVRCERGTARDVVVDLRPDSPTFLEHHWVDLDSRRGNALYIPNGFAHGFQTLQDDTRIVYLMTDYYAPGLADGVRFDDPAFRIDWPLPVSVISARDCQYPDFDRDDYVRRYRLRRV